MDTNKTHLPNIGVKFTFLTSAGAKLIITHLNDGTVELYKIEPVKKAATILFKFSEKEARGVAAILLGVPY